MKHTLYLLPLIFVIACGQQQKPVTNTTPAPKKDTTANEDNQKMYVDANGLRQGYWTLFNSSQHIPGYRDQDKIEEGVYKDGKKDGRWIKYYPGGTIMVKQTYRHDTLLTSDSMCMWNGPKAYVDINKLRQGYWVMLNSQVRNPAFRYQDTVERGSYKDGKKEGLWLEYSHGNVIKHKLTYKDDKVVKRG